MRTIVVGMLVGWGLSAGCGDSPTGPIVRFALPASGVPKPLDVPWPSDLYRTDADGTIVDGLLDWTNFQIDNPAPSALAEQYGALDGFGRLAGALFVIDGIDAGDAPDPATLPSEGAGADPSSTVALIDLDPSAAGRHVPCSAGWDAFLHVLVVAPYDPLAPGHPYAAVVTSGVKLASGGFLGAAPGFAAIRDGGQAGGDAKLYRDALDRVVGDAGIARDKIVALTVFTTQTTHRTLGKIRTALAGGAYGPPPSLLTSAVAAPYRVTMFGASAHAGWTATLDEWLGTPRRGMNGLDLAGLPGAPEPDTTGIGHDAIGAILSATFVSPEFRRPFKMTAGRDDGTIGYDATGAAIAYDPTAQVPVVIVVPRSAAPIAGFPVVIYQHGLGGDRTAALAVANELARAGIATVAIDAPLHGMRAINASDTASNGKGPFGGADGFKDGGSPLAILDMTAGVKNMIAATDNFWQAVLDLVQLRRLIGHCDLSAIAAEFGGVAPVLDPGHVGYIGMSMGGQLGTLLAGVEPRASIDPFVLDVPPSGVVLVIPEAPMSQAQVTLLAAQANVRTQLFDAARFGATLHLLQGLLDAADPGSFAADAASEHNIWMLRPLQDENVPSRSSDTLARALGATQITPTLRPLPELAQAASPLRPGATGRVVGYFETGPGVHGHLLERFGAINYEPPAPRDAEPRFPVLPKKIVLRQATGGPQRAIAHFMTTTWAGAPEIDVTGAAYAGLVPIPDVDDDGFCDDDERAAGTNPFDAASHPSGAPGCVRDVGFTVP